MVAGSSTFRVMSLGNCCMLYSMVRNHSFTAIIQEKLQHCTLVPMLNSGANAHVLMLPWYDVKLSVIKCLVLYLTCVMNGYTLNYRYFRDYPIQG